MKISKWLTVSSKGNVRVYAKKPATDWNEVAVQIEMDIPDTVFERPIFKAVLQFEEGEPPNIGQIDLDVVSAAIQDATGFAVRVILPEPL